MIVYVSNIERIEFEFDPFWRNTGWLSIILDKRAREQMPHNNNSDEANKVTDLNLPDMIVEFWFSLEPPAADVAEMRLLL